MSVRVSTGVFEGPFDLLLHLILSREVDIWEVSIAEIVDAYLVEIASMEALDLEAATEFLLIAATLVHLKSSRLLPEQEDPEAPEEFAPWEERDLLVARLIECATFKGAATAIASLMEEASRAHPRTAGPPDRLADAFDDLLVGVDVERLRDAAISALRPRPQPVIDLHHVAPVRISVAEEVVELSRRMQVLGEATFRELVSDCAGDRLRVVVRFLAILELVKQDLVEVEQAGTFATITVRWLAADRSARAELVDVYEG
ncbi:MAG: segregation/condensation protein A [Acidimicrobiales bacterium]|nr:MAG: segregation/condensation protein A [Acidimicrobiales bacterium]